jgi:hypothetical protein
MEGFDRNIILSLGVIMTGVELKLQPGMLSVTFLFVP